MPDLSFRIVGVEAAARGVTPLLHFKLRIEAASPRAEIHGLLVNAQIQLQCPQRGYSTAEKERLFELFGQPESWGKTLRNRLWTHANATVGAFAGATEIILPVPCTYDLNVASTKYFYALESGEVPLLFLFSGSIFYGGSGGGVQVERISWNKECVYRLPVSLWRELMQEHFPDSPWLSLRRDVFERLCAHKRHHGFVGWDETVESLLPSEAAAGEAEASYQVHASASSPEVAA